jgi:hypothetical protein
MTRLHQNRLWARLAHESAASRVVCRVSSLDFGQLFCTPSWFHRRLDCSCRFAPFPDDGLGWSRESNERPLL